MDLLNLKFTKIIIFHSSVKIKLLQNLKNLNPAQNIYNKLILLKL